MKRGRVRQRPLDTDTHSFCGRCKTWKRLEEFARHSARPSGRQCYCRECKTDLSRAYARRLNGWEPGRFERVFAEQGGRCAACHDELRPGLGGACADHSHRTGQPRGILCCRCNFIVGLIETQPRRLEQCDRYVKQHARRGVR